MWRGFLSRPRLAYNLRRVRFALPMTQVSFLTGAIVKAPYSTSTRLDLIARREKMPVANPNRWMEFAGFLRHFGDLDDARKCLNVIRVSPIEACACSAGYGSSRTGKLSSGSAKR